MDENEFLRCVLEVKSALALASNSTIESNQHRIKPDNPQSLLHKI